MAGRATSAARSAQRALSSLARLTPTGGVHGSQSGTQSARQWRSKPLLRVAGVDHYFKTGGEAVQLLVAEARRRDPHKSQYLDDFEAMMTSLTPVFDRAPRYAWIAKTFLEPERAIQFRVSYIDDSGNTRSNRGYRIQYSNALGPYGGALHFGPSVDSDNLKGMAFATNFSNALTRTRLGGAAGGSNFDPSRASETEIQRFCQSYMIELAKYIGPETDRPMTGTNVGANEIGYLYGAYKRTANVYASHGKGLLWGGSLQHPESHGWGAVHFAERVLSDRGETLAGKRCLITGSGQVALAVAERLLALGAIPVTMSDSTGHIYEPDGITEPRFRQIEQIKGERGARIGRYIMASTTAKYSDPSNIFAVPCDVAFLASSQVGQVDAANARLLAENGCQAVIDAAHAPSTPAAIKVYKKLGMMYAPYKATLAAGVCVAQSEVAMDEQKVVETLEQASERIHNEIKRTANEYNIRGDLNAGANIASFLRVANVLAAHGSF